MAQDSAALDAAEAPRAKPVGEHGHEQQDTNRDKPAESGKSALDDARSAAYSPGTQLPRETVAPGTASLLPNFFDVPASEKALKTPPGTPIDKSTALAQAGQDRVSELPVFQQQSPLSKEGQDLLAVAEKRIKIPGYPNAAKEFEQFEFNLRSFERSARASGLSGDEIKDTYKGIDRLLQSTAPGRPGVTDGGIASGRQRVRVAEQLMDMVASPYDRQQGSYETCAMASVEGLLLTGKDRQPSKVTGMVADVALTGQTNVRGLEVKIDRQSLQSFGEHAENRDFGENKQRLAENIFRVTAANTYFAIKRAEGSPEGQLSYVSRKDGNHLKYTPDAKDKSLHRGDLAFYNAPGIDINAPGPAATMTGESRILNQITGKDYKDRVIVNSNSKNEDPAWVTRVSSNAELEAHLKKLEGQGKLPASLAVYTGHEAFSGKGNPFNMLNKVDSDAEAKEVFGSLFQDGHSLLITNSNGQGDKTKFVVKNTWGAESNIDVSSQKLYDATNPVSPNQMITNLQLWKIGSVDMHNKKQRDDYETALTSTASYIVGGLRNLSADAPASTKEDYLSAGHRVKEIMDAMPPHYQKKLAAELKALKTQGKKEPLAAELYKLWQDVIK